MIEEELVKLGIIYKRLPKMESIVISQEWNVKFLSSSKEKTGKYVSGRYKWEAYWSKNEPCLSGQKALLNYENNEIEDFYIIDETGKNVFSCNACKWHNFSNTQLDLYVVPKNMVWSMAFSHEGTCHYAISKT